MFSHFKPIGWCCQTNELKHLIAIRGAISNEWTSYPLLYVFFDLACELRTKPVPPVKNGFIAHVHASFVQEVFHISQ